MLTFDQQGRVAEISLNLPKPVNHSASLPKPYSSSGET